MPQYYMIESRKLVMTPTIGSKRRVYNGCYSNSDWVLTWSDWDWLSLKLTEDEALKKLDFWQGLNAYAVKERGHNSKQEFRIAPDTVYDGTW